MVVPISEASLGYAQEVRGALRRARMHADVDTSDRKMQKKVREAQLEQYNYILARSRPLSSPPRQAPCPPRQSGSLLG
jgi:threonyl-tRNA synthetase